jgi:hypothetical protein
MTWNGIGKWGPGFLSAMLMVSLCRYGVGQQGAATMQLKEHGGALTALASRLTLECGADSATIFTGQTGVIRARGVSVTGSALTYSFAASAGQLLAKGAVAELRTAGLSPQVVQVTCTVKDSLGNSASKVVQVTLRKLISIQEGKADVFAPHPVVPPQTTKTESATIPMSPKPAQPPILLPSPAPVESVQQATAAPPPPPPPAEATPKPDSGQPVTAVDGYQQGKTFDEWKKGLKTGKIEYLVPTRMLMQQASMATVVIHGYGDTETTTLPNATGSGSLTQSERMKVELLAEDHPSDFTIVAQGDAVRFVPISGATAWTWSVTPNTPGKKELMVRASVIYPGGDEKMQQQLKPYTAVVAVNVPSLWERIVESYHEDPLKWFSYVVPGGAGFTFLVGIVVWWWKKKKEKTV